MRWPWRSERILTTNDLGADGAFKIGAIVSLHGQKWRVTKHRPAYDGWGGIKVYARRVK